MIKCNICKSDRIELFDKCYKDLFKCMNCGLVFQFPQGSFDYSNYSNTRITGKKKRIIQYKKDVLDTLKHIHYGKILDIGCGDGTFLKYFPKTFIKDGIDIRGIYRIGEFVEYDFAKERYDIILLRGTLEHLKSPSMVIEKAFSLLNLNGILALLHVPNIDNYPFMKSLIKRDEHLFYFNPKSIQLLLERYKFSVIDITYSYYDTPYQFDSGSKFMNVMNIYSRKERC